MNGAYQYNGLGTTNVSDVFVLFGFAALIYFVINFTLSCIVRSLQKQHKRPALQSARVYGGERIMEKFVITISRQFTSMGRSIAQNLSEDLGMLQISRDHKIRSGVSYRLYFNSSGNIPSGQNPLLTKAVLTDNLLGVEEITPAPTVSDKKPNTT